MPRKKKKEVDRTLKVAASQIKKYLDGHPNSTLSTAALADQYHVNRNALQSFFKERYKFHMGEYKLRLRMAEAKRLLKQGRSMKEVAITLRYASPSSFSNAFKSYYSESATKWLEELYRKSKIKDDNQYER
jgi:AraC-like DNA-binding protein